MCLLDFHNFSTIYVSKVEKFIVDIPNELPCLGDLENIGKLPVQEILMIVSFGCSQFLHYVFRVKESNGYIDLML